MANTSTCSVKSGKNDHNQNKDGTDYFSEKETVIGSNQCEPIIKASQSIERSADNEIDLNSQPTMVACRSDVLLDGDCNKECPLEIVFPEDQDSKDAASADEESMKTNDDDTQKVDYKLSKMLDTDPLNKVKFTTDESNCSSEIIYETFRPFKEEFRFVNFKELVSSEVVKFGINQSIFAKTVLKRSQGYLSDLLNHQQAIFTMNEPSRMMINFLKIKNFLELDDMQRRACYLRCVKEADTEQQQIEVKSNMRISHRKKRVNLTKDVKDGLRMIFKDRTTMPDPCELSQISDRFGLDISTLKNFFRNFKARSKIS